MLRLARALSTLSATIAAAPAAALQTGAAEGQIWEAAGGPGWQWTVHAAEGGLSLSETDGAFPRYRFFAPMQATHVEEGALVQGRSSSGARVALSIVNEVCRSDGGGVYPYSARLEVDGVERTGCAWQRLRHSGGDRLPLGDFDLNRRVAAKGENPAWEAQLGPGGPTRLVIDGAVFTEDAEALPTVAAGTAVYELAGANDRRVRATLRVQGCRLAGRPMPFTIEVQAGERSLRGCASQAYFEQGPGIVSTPAPQVRLLSGSITAADYPASALRAAASGRVRYEYKLDPTGRVTACAVRYSSGNAALDRTTCRLAMSRFRYEPVRDAAGNPIEFVGMASQPWELPPE